MEIKNLSKPQDPAILGINGKGTWASGSGIRVSVAMKHEAEVIPVAENLAAYLYKAHGDAILQYLHPSAQEDALDTVWIQTPTVQSHGRSNKPARLVQMIQYRNGYRRLSKKMELCQA
jgi:hypothetical protein